MSEKNVRTFEKCPGKMSGHLRNVREKCPDIYGEKCPDIECPEKMSGKNVRTFVTFCPEKCPKNVRTFVTAIHYFVWPKLYISQILMREALYISLNHPSHFGSACQIKTLQSHPLFCSAKIVHFADSNARSVVHFTQSPEPFWVSVSS